MFYQQVEFKMINKQYNNLYYLKYKLNIANNTYLQLINNYKINITKFVSNYFPK